MLKTSKHSLFAMLLGFCLLSTAQDTDPIVTLSQEQALALYDSEQEAKIWFENLRKPGVEVKEGTMFFSEEAQKLMNDADYRASVYKEEYGLLDVKQSLSTLELQKAFWQLINMYPENKELALKFIYAYDNIVPTDEVVVGAFYTYAFFDPNITTLSSGKPDVHRPDLFEEYLRRTKEIVAYINYFRENKDKAE